jgi:hypothetical protein
MAKPMLFQAFINKFFPWFEIDTNNHQVITKIGQWALNDPLFEDREEGWYLEKGICISGPVGVGKTKLFEFLQDYLTYLRSPLIFESRVVWEFAQKYSKDGDAAFYKERLGNRFYDELCLTSDKTGQPDREQAIHFGNRILVGSEIIMLRYKVFAKTGYQSHFTTNVDIPDLKKLYGVREYDRLLEMCNFFIIEGSSKRGGRPAVRRNILREDLSNHSLSLAADTAKQKMVELNDRYKRYLENGLPEDNDGFDYQALVGLGCSLATDDEIKQLSREVIDQRKKFVEESTRPWEETLGEVMTAQRWRQLKSMHKDGVLDKDEKALLWMRCKMILVLRFYERMKKAMAEVIFSEI